MFCFHIYISYSLNILIGHFYPDIVDFCETYANLGKTVVVAALDGTYERKPFGKILELLPLSESVLKLNAVCTQCADIASFSKRISKNTELEIIGGSDLYKAVCRKCFFSNEILHLTESSSNAIATTKTIDSTEISTDKTECNAPKCGLYFFFLYLIALFSFW